jgi:hypothetical protein
MITATRRCPTDAQTAFSQAVRDSMDDIAKPLKTGAGEGIRTLDPNLGKVVLYP